MSDVIAMTELELAMRKLANQVKNDTIDACVNAARDGFEASMTNYALIGPSGMAMQTINSIKALKGAQSHKEAEEPTNG